MNVRDLRARANPGVIVRNPPPCEMNCTCREEQDHGVLALLNRELAASSTWLKSPTAATAARTSWGQVLFFDVTDARMLHGATVAYPV